MTNQIWLPTIHSSLWLVSRTFCYEGPVRAAARAGKWRFFFLWQLGKILEVDTNWRTSQSTMNTPSLNDTTVQGQIDSHFPWARAKAHVLEHACWLIQHAVEVGECVIAVRRGWHAPLCWFWAQRFRTCHWITKRNKEILKWKNKTEWEKDTHPP